MRLLHSKPHPYHIQVFGKIHAWHYEHGVDVGYTMHAALERVFGDKKPVSFRYNVDRGLFAYTDLSDVELAQIIANGDIEAVNALGLGVINDSQEYRLIDLPEAWQKGEKYFFEAQCLPTHQGNDKEIGIIAYSRSKKKGNEFIDDGELLRNWFFDQMKETTELRSWSEAVEINQVKIIGKSIEAIMRKTAELNSSGERERHWLRLDKVTYQGELTILDVPKFEVLLKRGFGRNRTFGYGMLLLQKQG